MRKIHHFQRYSQKENVVTNNTLRLFSSLYSYNPIRFQGFLGELLEEIDAIEIGPEFYQQGGNETGSSVPDGTIVQQSFKIVLETKLYNNFTETQLINHVSSFKGEDKKILLLINPEPLTEQFIKNIKKKVQDISKNILFATTTFERVIDCVGNVLTDYDVDMNELIEDFRLFCQEENLLPEYKFYVRAITSGSSFDENMEYGIYYDPMERGYSRHAYLGLYKDKAVRAIGKLSKIVVAEYDEKNGRIIPVSFDLGDSLTSDEELRIRTIMECANLSKNWDIYTNHRFFIVDKFYETIYEKETKYPIQRTKFFNLKDKDVLGLEELPSTQEIAKLLNGKKWK